MRFAERYRELGYSVIPLPTREKAPPPFGWNEYAKRAPTADEVKAWWGRNPAANIGAATGAGAGVCLVDLDGPIAREWGRKNGLRSPMTVITGREDGGLQLWYKWPEKGIQNSASKFAPGVDIRGEGGYGILPPSVHPNGRVYCSLSGTVQTSLLPSLPLVFLVTSVAAPIRKQEGWIATALGGLVDGNRNATFASVVGKLHRERWSADDIRVLLIPHAMRVQFDAAELDSVIRSVTRYSVPSLASAASKSEAIDDFLKDTQKVEWICEPIIAKRSIGFVAGLPETCKTWTLMDLAVECAGGSGQWLQLFPVSAGRVLFIDQERFKGETQRRFAALIAAKSLAPETLRERLSIKCGTTIKLDSEASFQAFRSELLELKPDLVIVDSFATFHGAAENDRTAIQVVLNRIKALRDEIGCAFIFINHEGKTVFQDAEAGVKPSAFRMVGSVGIVAAAEFVLTVRKMEDGQSIIHHTKSTMATSSKSFYASVIDTPEGVVVKGSM